MAISATARANFQYAANLKKQGFKTAVHALPEGGIEMVEGLLEKGESYHSISRLVNEKYSTEISKIGLKRVSAMAIRTYAMKYWSKSPGAAQKIVDGNPKLKERVGEVRYKVKEIENLTWLNIKQMQLAKKAWKYENKTILPTRITQDTFRQAAQFNRDLITAKLMIGVMEKQTPSPQLGDGIQDGEIVVDQTVDDLIKEAFKQRMAADAILRTGRYGGGVIDNTSEEQKKLRVECYADDLSSLEIKAAKSNFGYFCERVLGVENNQHHFEWADILEQLLAGGSKKFGLLAPRNHAKSQVVSIEYPLWVIGNNRDIRILILSNAASQAESFLRSIKMTIEKNDKYKQVFGQLMPQFPEKWTQSEIMIQRNSAEKDLTIATSGAGGSILSKRADIIIADDILDKDNTRTPEQRLKVLQWWRDVVMPVLDPEHGKVLWVGTVWHKEDLAHQIMQDPTYDFKKKYQAIIREAERQDLWNEYKSIMLSDIEKGKLLAEAFYVKNQAEMDKGALVLWPNRWPYRRLIDEKISVGSRSFSLSYQNDAEDDENAIIKRAWVEACANKKMTLLSSFESARDIIGIKIRTQGIDLAGFKDDSDWNVDATVGITNDNKFILMNMVYGHWTPSTTRKTIIEQGTKFDPLLILVESNAYQVSMVKDSQEMSTLPIKGFQTTGEKYDEILGINGMAVSFENGQWIIPSNPNDKHTLDIYERVLDGLVSFNPNSHTSDHVMALWMAWTAARQYLGTNMKTGSAKTTGEMYKGVSAD